VNRFVLLLPFLPLAAAQTLPAPHFHHLHLNSTNPDKAIDFYTRQFPSTAKTVVAGLPALKSGAVYLLFTRVKSPPPTGPQSPIWHFGWHVTDVRKNLESYRRSSEVKLLPMYTSPDQARPDAFISSDTWPGLGGVLGLTREQIAEAKAKGSQPQGGPGFAYMQGPDGAIIEYQGNFPAERFNHVHMYQEDPYCAGLWYRNHLGAAGDVPRGEGDCKAERSAFSWPALVAEGTRRAPRVNMNFDATQFQYGGTWSSCTFKLTANGAVTAPAAASYDGRFMGNDRIELRPTSGSGLPVLTLQRQGVGTRQTGC